MIIFTKFHKDRGKNAFLLTAKFWARELFFSSPSILWVESLLVFTKVLLGSRYVRTYVTYLIIRLGTLDISGSIKVVKFFFLRFFLSLKNHEGNKTIVIKEEHICEFFFYDILLFSFRSNQKKIARAKSELHLTGNISKSRETIWAGGHRPCNSIL